MNKILGLDLGTNSIGWALIENNEENTPKAIIDLGSRIIPMGDDVIGKFDKGITESDTAARTSYRGVRRLRERVLLRRERLHRVLNILGFLPEHYASQIDFENRLGQFLPETEPKLVYDQSNNFIFKQSFEEMLAEFKINQPALFEKLNAKGEANKIPYDWTIYYLRKKALSQKITNEELAWLLLNFNQKRGYYQLRGEEDDIEENKNKTFEVLKVMEVIDSGQSVKGSTLYDIFFENGWKYDRQTTKPSDWIGKNKEFIVTESQVKNGELKRTFKAVDSEKDWGAIKAKTEQTIDKSGKTVGQYIYDALLENPSQKINGKLVRVVERKYYKAELKQILETQIKLNNNLNDAKHYKACIAELYKNNEAHSSNLASKSFLYLFLDDILFYQRPLKSKKSQISDCKFETRIYKTNNGEFKNEPIKCIAKSHPFFQEFRLWQWMQNLKIYDRETDKDVTNSFLPTENEYVSLFENLNDRKEIDQKAILKYFNLKDKTHRWNFVEDKTYPLNETRGQILAKLNKCESIPANFLSKEIEVALWHILYSVNDKLEIPKALGKFAIKHNLGNDFVEQFSKFPPYKSDYGSYSAKAINKILPLIRMGKYWNQDEIDSKTTERINKIIDGEFDPKIQVRVREKAINLTEIMHFRGLPLWLTSYIVYDRHSEEGDLSKWKTPLEMAEFINEFKQHSLRNPIVEQIILETLRVVKDIWTDLGQGAENFFNEIHIELGREMKNPANIREQMTKKISENENTNLRIKALLAEMLNDGNVDNVRPYSPSQQEILKIYEDGVLNGETDIPDDILKISKTAKPAKSDLIRYKLWLEQRYCSPYTGAIIPLNKLFTPAYEIEHIIPQSRFFDDSFSNKVICETEVNKLKDNQLAFEFIHNHKGEKVTLNFGKTAEIFTTEAYEQFIKTYFAKSQSKMKKLLMLEIPEKFAERQMNDSRYISKEVKNLLSKIVRAQTNDDGPTSKNVLSTNGQITTALRQDWGLNDVWNDIVSPRFERLNSMTGNERNFGEINEKTQKFLPTVPLELQKGFNKKRIDHRHHAMDALVIACAGRNHINYLNNQNALEKGKNKEQKQKSREDLKRILCSKTVQDAKGNYKWVFKKPWDNFTQDTRNKLQATVISFKQNQRVINKTVNKYVSYKNEDGNLRIGKNGMPIKDVIKQINGNSWAIRKPMHAETVSGLVTLQRIKEAQVNLSGVLETPWLIVNKEIRTQLAEKAHHYKNNLPGLKKYLKTSPIKIEGKEVEKVWIYETIKATATRKSLDITFDEKRIGKITDTGIQKILFNHLKNYQNVLDANGKAVLPHEAAFTDEGIDLLNKNIVYLNNGKKHQPIKKVRFFEESGKFALGTKGNKKTKYVEAAKGTNLFFAIYIGENGKRNYASIPFNEVLESQKLSAELGQKPNSVPQKNENGDPLLFSLSPYDLVYVPTEAEQAEPKLVNFNNLTKEQVGRIYKNVSFADKDCFFVRNDVASTIINKFEFTTSNKMERTIDGIQIKASCWKLKVNRLGKIIKVER